MSPSIEPPRERRPVSPRAAHRALRSIELVLIVAGCALLGGYGSAKIYAVVASAAALERFELAQAAHTAPATPEFSAGGDPDQSLWGNNRVAAYRASLDVALDVPLGVLAVPKIGLRVPVFEGTGEIVLNRGVGRIEGTAPVSAAGNLGIAGHRDGFFRGLKDIAIGDVIELRSLEDTVHYRVTELLIVEPTDVYVLEPTAAATLTLVTCYPFYFVGDAPQRFIVKAVAQPSSAGRG